MVNEQFHIFVRRSVDPLQLRLAQKLFCGFEISFRRESFGLLANELNLIRGNGEGMIKRRTGRVEIAFAAIAPSQVDPDILVARVERGRLPDIRDRFIQLSLPPFHQPDVKKNVAVVRGMFARFVQLDQRAIEVLQTEVIENAKRRPGFAQLRPQTDRRVGRLPRPFQASGCVLFAEIDLRFRDRNLGPSLGVGWIQGNGLSQEIPTFPHLLEVLAIEQLDPAEIGIVSFWVGRGDGRDLLSLATGELRFERTGDFLRDLRFDREDVGQLAIVSLRPEMRIAFRLDQLHVDPDRVARLLHAPFQNMGDPQLLRDLR